MNKNYDKDEDNNSQLSDDDKQYWQSLYEMYKESSKQFDRNVLYIASGALVLSLTFIKEIIDFNKVQCKPLLIISWSLFVLIIVISLLSHYFSMRAINQKMQTIENDNDPSSSFLNSIVSGINIVMIILLPLALLFLMIFTYLNL